MLKELLLKDIEDIKNYRDVEPPSEKDPDMIELRDSIKKEGVLQAILVRPHPTIKGKYQLVFGHRRRLASKMAGLESIPSTIKDIADGDVLETQVTENLQRKDVHPMDEAIAFRSLMKDKNYSAEEIAARFGKKPEFVVMRLKLNDLIPDFQNRFKKNVILLGHAMILCRLTTSDQKEIGQQYGSFGDVSSLKDFVERNVLRQLSSAPFKKDDATLNPKAGPCSTCQKRSGCKSLLFADMKDDDRCFDKACFETKMDAFFLLQLQDIIETKPNIHLVTDGSSIPKAVAALLKQMNVEPLGHDKFERYGGYGKFKKQAKGFYLTGYSRGKTESIYVQGPSASAKKGEKPGKRTTSDVQAEIEGLKTRQKRALELDIEKIHVEILRQVEKCKPLKEPGLVHMGTTDRGIMVFLLIDVAAAYSAKEKIRKGLKSIPKEPPHSPHAYQPDYINKLGAISDDDLAFIVRTICLDKYGNKNLVNGIDEEDTTLRLMAEYAGVDIKSIEKAQEEISAKRIERSNKRLKALLEEKKELESKGKSKPAKKTAPAKTKKAGRTKAIAKSISTLLEDQPDEDPQDEE